MLWCDKLVQGLHNPQIINDSKTPSGRVHVGALRGVLIHDAVFRTLKERRVPARYLFGVDDYDPLDEIPAGQDDHFRQYLGVPLCNVPSPPGSKAPDMAEHYISEFFEVFHEIGVRPEIYRMRDIYRSGRFNEAIDAILRNAGTVREIYKEISNADRPDRWHPFQVICERCGRIGTTEVVDFDGREVLYGCQPSLVQWATGCGHSGKISPFDGNGKLPWKLEWTAKWQEFPVTIEGAGKDHNTRGSSRDVAVACLRRIFNLSPPINIPYEFFLVGGAKMSSSRGIGASAREIADLLPAEALRFLLIRPKPNQPVNFSPDEKSIVKLFNDLDRYHWRAYHDPAVSDEEKRVYFLSEIDGEGDFYDVHFQLLLTLVQLPHVDVAKEIEQRKGSPLTPVEKSHLEQRMRSARFWLDHYATEADRLHLQETLPERAHALTATQRAFLHACADRLPEVPRQEDSLQAMVFEVARLTPIAERLAFEAIYTVLLDRTAGPKAGNLLACLGQEFLVKRFQELSFSIHDFWEETCIAEADFEAWLGEHKNRVCDIEMKIATRFNEARPTNQQQLGIETSPMEFTVTLDDGKKHAKRVFLGRSAEPNIEESGSYQMRVAKYVEKLSLHYPVRSRKIQQMQA